MIFGYLGRKRKNRAIVDGLYSQVTDAARDPVYYRDTNVPDTVMGRFEMLPMVMVLFLRGTHQAGPAVAPLAQDMVDTFFEDIDHSIRELGVGDVSVPKRMKKLARMFYGRAESYGDALNNGDADALAEALSRNIYPAGGTDRAEPDNGSRDMAALARTFIDLDRHFAGLQADDLMSGRLVMPTETRSVRLTRDAG